MDASDALSELVGLSTQVVEVVLTGPDGAVEATRTPGESRSRTLASLGQELVATASELRAAADVERVQVDLDRGSLVVVRDGERTIVAITVPEPTAGLVTYDLRVALRKSRGEES